MTPIHDRLSRVLAGSNSSETVWHPSTTIGAWELAGPWETCRIAPRSEAVRKVRESNAWTATKLLFEHMVLTCARSGEVRMATWDEVDVNAATWTVPAERMKAGKEHRVPLPKRCVAILREAEGLPRASGLLFPSMNGKTISDATVGKLLRQQGVDATAHGFRSTFRDWAAEQTDTPHAVMEAALAHTIPNAAEAAYARSDLLTKRRELMQRWSDFVAA